MIIANLIGFGIGYDSLFELGKNFCNFEGQVSMKFKFISRIDGLSWRPFLATYWNFANVLEKRNRRKINKIVMKLNFF